MTDMPIGENGAETRPHDAAMPIMVLASIIGGLVIGTLLWVSWLYYYIPFLSPLFAAAVAVWYMGKVIHFTRINNLALVTICGVLISLLLYGTLWVGRYFYTMGQLREDLRTVVEEESLDVTLDDATADRFINDYFEDETGQRGFIGYAMLEAEDGMTIKPTRSTVGSRQETNIGTPLTVLYWVIEIGLILRMVVLMSRANAKKYHRAAVSSPAEAL